MDTTPRWTLPLLAPGQAQKDLTHNESIALIDLLLDPVVEAVALDIPPAAPAPGQSWIVGANPTGAWAGRTHAIAGWTAGGWRFAIPRVGSRVRTRTDEAWVCTGSEWTPATLSGSAVRVGGEQVVGERCAAIDDPVAGTTIDREARDAVSAILTALRGHGLIAS